MISLVTYYDEKYELSHKLLIKSAKKCKFDKTFNYTYNDLDNKFKNKNKKILKCKRGAGYWIWKPYIILKTFSKLNKGDIIVYSDSGLYFKKNIKRLLKIFDSCTQDIMPFSHGRFKEINWTKRDTLKALKCDERKYLQTPQIWAGFIMLRVSEQSKKFLEDWLAYCEDFKLISDSKSLTPNYKDFFENRHDQSIFSLLVKKNNYLTFRDPSEYGNYQKYYYSKDVLDRSRFPQIIIAHKNGFCSSYLKARIILLKRKIPWIKRTFALKKYEPFGVYISEERYRQ